MAVVNDHKVRLVVTRLNNQRPPIGTSSTATMGSGSKGCVVHGTRQYINGTLVAQPELEAEQPSSPAPVTIPNGHGLKVPTLLVKSENMKHIPKPSEPQPPPLPKPSIMKKPLAPGSPPVNQKGPKEPWEVQKLVTFTDQVQYESEDSRGGEIVEKRNRVHSDGNLMKSRISNSTDKKTQIVSRSKMISSTSSPDMKSINKLKGIKNVCSPHITPMSSKSFRIIPDSQLPSFKDLFENALEYNNALKSTAGNKSKFNAPATPSLPLIQINLLPTNPINSKNERNIQNAKHLKVPRIKGKNSNNNFSGHCGSGDNSSSFKVFDRVLVDGSVENFRSGLQDPRELSVTVNDNPEKIVGKFIEDEVILMQFWDCLEKWQKHFREERKNCSRIGYENSMYLNNLKNELLLQESSNRNNNILNRSSVNRHISSRIVKMSAPGVPAKFPESEENKDRIRMQKDHNKPPVDRLPLVTTLLRAAKEGNELLIKAALRDIIINGITKEQLNLTDKSGRTAVSYICSNGLLQFLDIILQLPVDVNRCDNEGNTPLHFAAEAGRAEIINMLITRCRTLDKDHKNNLGFTPLMKAALQGRSKCAKILLLGGASALETDPKRRMRADEWANFCGQYSCGEVIMSCGKAMMLEKTGSCKWPTDSSSVLNKKYVTRTNTGTIISPNNISISGTSTGGIRSKLRKVFPFGLALKDKSAGNNINKNKRSETSDLVSYLSAAALCASSGPALAKDQTTFIKNLIRHQDVPKLEVTYANNNTLIKKIENSRYTESEPQSNHKSSSVLVRIK